MNLHSIFTFDFATIPGMIRLVNGTMGAWSGRLEIYHDGEWGTICDDEFSAAEARVSSCEWAKNNHITLWRHAIETVSALLALCEENPTITGEFPSQRAGNADFGIFFDVSLKK